MGKWKQVSGDMDFSGVGCVLAKDSPRSRSVNIVRIEPWLEMDSSALRQGYGFWDVSTTTIDYEDMGVDNETVQGALDSIGMDAKEYKKLEPPYKAEIIASYSGYGGESSSTSDYAEALPVPIGEIEFYRGKTKESIDEINDSMRHEVAYKLYGDKFDSDKLPDDDALELAFGDKPRTFDLTEDEAQAVRYALAVASGTYSWIFPKAKLDTTIKVKDKTAMMELLVALRDAPDSSDLPPHKITSLQSSYEQSFDLDWEDKREQTAYFIDEDAKECRLLVNSLLGQLGLR